MKPFFGSHSYTRKLALSAFSVWMAIGSAAPVQAETLAQALTNAYNHSGLIDQNRALLRAADEDVAIAMSALKPIIGWSADMTRSFSKVRTNGLPTIYTTGVTSVTLGLSASLLLYDFGQSDLRIDVAKEKVLATRETLVSVEQGVLLRAVTAYMNVRRNNEFVALRNSNVRLITQELRAAKDRFEVGEVTRTDVALAEARLAAARAGLAGAQGNLAQAQEEYRASVGHRPKSLSPPPKAPKTANTPNAAKAIAERNHPDMKSVQHEVAAAELAVLMAEAAMKPSVNLVGRLGVTENFNSTNYTHSGSVGVQASGPIYQGGRLSAVARQSMAQRDAVRSSLHLQRHNISQNVGNAFAQLEVYRATRQAGERQVRAASVAFRGVREEATLGARTTLDTLNAEQELLDARANLISSIVDEQIASYSLLATMGLLTAKHLKLSVQSYDPASYYNMVREAPALKSRQGQKLDRILRAIGKE